MRFVTFVHHGAERAGVLESDAGRVVDLADPAFADVLPGGRADVMAFVQAGLAATARTIAARIAPQSRRLALAELRLRAPLRPRRIIGVAHNYHDALRERGMAPPAEPVVFVKQPDTVVGPGDAIVLPPEIGGVTYEAELAAVIGRRADAISAEDALVHVAGYCAFNDVSASELIRREGTFDRGKNLPTFGPMGPFLATASEIPEPQNLRIRFTMDDEVLQDGSTRDMLFPLAELIARFSRDVPLEPGDMIATGTPAGVAPMRKPPTWLKSGSICTVTVEGLGSLSNPVMSQHHV